MHRLISRPSSGGCRMGDVAAVLRIPALLVSIYRAGLLDSFRWLLILDLATSVPLPHGIYSLFIIRMYIFKLQ